MELARRRLTELFSGIRFSEEEETVPLFFHRPNLFSNQVACFASDNPVEEVTACLKAIEREAGRKPEEKEQEIVRLDIDLLSCDGTVYTGYNLYRQLFTTKIGRHNRKPHQIFT